MSASFGIVDLFAGPGGLGEGFASLSECGHSPFHVGISVEKEISAHQTLRLRSFLRSFKARHGALPGAYLDLHAGATAEVDWESVDAVLWKGASEEARCLELGTPTATEATDAAIRKLRRGFDDTILIGGPPCQAYSLVGRARARGKRDYVPEKDERHFLFREYIRVLDRLRPAAFVMENVKGMLSSTVESRLVFDMLTEDLASLGTRRGHLYELLAIRVVDGVARLEPAAKPADFVVRAEHFGVPQRRHRVILVGIRTDLAGRAGNASVPVSGALSTVDDAIGNLPPLRSGLSRQPDDPVAWRDEVISVARRIAAKLDRPDDRLLAKAFGDVSAILGRARPLPRSAMKLPTRYAIARDGLRNWIERPELKAIAQHESRSHMASDLGRYLFASVFGSTRGYSPKSDEFPRALAPAHSNWRSGIFNDRFRVQLRDEPSTTITSHIAKDGHYFIHPDPAQCRSLTVREAARLQTFPDDYLFLGNRTQQYVQVGNAVPPFLARHIAALLKEALTGGAPRSRRAESRQAEPV